MNREKKLIKNTIIITIGKISTQFISFFLLPLYTAILSTEEYGIVDLLNTYTVLLAPIIIFEIAQGMFRYLIDVREDENGKKNVISTTIITVIVQCIVFIIIYCIIAKFINNEYKHFLGINVIAAIFSSIMLQISRGLGDNTTYTIGSIITAVSTIILNIIFIVIFRLGAYGMLTASLLANFLCTIFIFIRKKIYKYLKFKYFNKNKLHELWKYSMPLVPNSISWWILSVSDRMIVNQFLGVGANGIYAAANKISSIFTTFSSIFNMTWIESAAMHISDKDSTDFFSNIINTALKVFSTACLGIIAYMPIIYPILINEKFSESYYHIPILMVGTLFNVMIGLIGAVYIAKKKTKEVAKTGIIAAIINITINILLINKIGLYAASISTAIAYFIMMAFRMIHVQKYIIIKYDWKIITLTVIWLAIVFSTYYINNTYINIIMAVLVSLYAIYINRDWLIVIVKQIGNKIRNFRNIENE